MEIRPILSTLRRHKVAATLIVVEIALACAIICNALFLVSERVDRLTMPSGIVEDEVLEIRVAGLGSGTNAAARTREDLAALTAIPGVRAATLTNQFPFYYSSSNSGMMLDPDQERPSLVAAQYVDHGGLLDTFGLRLVSGRDFRTDEYIEAEQLLQMTDFSGLRSSIIVSAAMAEKLFPGQEAVGNVVYNGPVPMTIVGVVETLTRPSRVQGNDSYSFILPIRHDFTRGFYAIRVDDPARRDEVLAAAVAALERVDPNRLVVEQRTYSDIRAGFFAGDRAMIGLLLTVCLALLVVTALGIVGLASFWVQQRNKQIGIRRALGATRGQILRYFQTENFLLATVGITLGMVLAFGLNQLLMQQYELARLPLAYLPLGALVLWLLGQLAVLGPARRAAAVPPAVATRST